MFWCIGVFSFVCFELSVSEELVSKVTYNYKCHVELDVKLESVPPSIL